MAALSAVAAVNILSSIFTKREISCRLSRPWELIRPAL